MAMVAAAALLAACGDEGGELREATERRRQQQASLDTIRDSTAAARRVEEGYEVPAFVDGDTTAAASDTTAAAASADSAAQQPLGAWTAGVRRVERETSQMPTLRDVRVGRNAGFDRVVLEFAGGEIPGYEVEYVDRPVRACGSGDVVDVAGEGWLRVRLRPAQAHDDAGQATVAQRERALNMAVIRELEFTCDFEGEVEIVLGVASPNEFRVSEIANPARLVIDVRQ